MDAIFFNFYQVNYLGGYIMKLRNLLLTGLCGIVLGTTWCSNSVSKELTTERVLVVGMECASNHLTYLIIKLF